MENSNELKYTTYGTGSVLLGERWYTLDELREIIKGMERLNRHAKQAMGISLQDLNTHK